MFVKAFVTLNFSALEFIVLYFCPEQCCISGDQYVIESDGLLIKGVTRANAGIFTCRARVPQTGELEEKDIRLDVGRIILIVLIHESISGTRAPELDNTAIRPPGSRER